MGGLLASLPAHANNILIGFVLGVSDGDTITVLDGQLQQHKVRAMGIGAPEKAQAFGDKSKANLARIVFNKDVDVEWNKPDRYHRIVGKIKVQPPDCPSCAQSLDAWLAQVATGMAWWNRECAGEQSSFR